MSKTDPSHSGIFNVFQELEEQLHEKDKEMAEMEKEHKAEMREKEKLIKEMEQDMKKMLRRIDKLQKKLATLGGIGFAFSIVTME